MPVDAPGRSSADPAVASQGDSAHLPHERHPIEILTATWYFGGQPMPRKHHVIPSVVPDQQLRQARRVLVGEVPNVTATKLARLRSGTDHLVADSLVDLPKVEILEVRQGLAVSPHRQIGRAHV